MTTQSKSLQVVHLSKLESGGATRYAQALDKGLVDRGVRSTLLHASDLQQRKQPSFARSKFLNRAVNRFYVEVQNEVFHRTNRFAEYEWESAINGADIVHVHQATNWMGLNHLMRAIPQTTPVVVSLHDLWLITGGCVVYNGCEKFKQNCGGCPALKFPFRFLAGHQLQAKRAAYDREQIQFIANSQWTSKKMHGATVIGEKPISVIHPAVDTDLYSPGDQTEARRELGVAVDSFVICMGAASITDQNKNIPAGLAAIAQVKSDKPILVLLFGEGSIDVPTGLDVRLLGGIEDHAKLKTVYVASDVFVSPSLMETYGMTLIESLACQRPVVAFDVGAIGSVIPDEKVGLLAKSGDNLDLSQKIERLANDAQRCKQLGVNGRKLVVDRNSVAQLIESHLQLYQAATNVKGTVN